MMKIRGLQFLLAFLIALMSFIALTSSDFSSLTSNFKIYVWILFVASLALNASFTQDRQTLIKTLGENKGARYPQYFFIVICLGFSFYSFYRASISSDSHFIVCVVAGLILGVMGLLLIWGLHYMKK